MAVEEEQQERQFTSPFTFTLPTPPPSSPGSDDFDDDMNDNNDHGHAGFECAACRERNNKNNYHTALTQGGMDAADVLLDLHQGGGSGGLEIGMTNDNLPDHHQQDKQQQHVPIHNPYAALAAQQKQQQKQHFPEMRSITPHTTRTATGMAGTTQGAQPATSMGSVAAASIEW